MPVVPVDLPVSPGGEDLVNPPHQIADERAQYLQDILVDLPGLIRQRGPLKLHTDFVKIPGYEPVDVAICPHPSGQGISVAVVARKAADSKWYLIVLTPDHSQISFEVEVAPASVTSLETDIKPSPHGGVIISVFDRYSRPATAFKRLFWRGATKPAYSTGTVTLNHNTTTVTGSGTQWNDNAEAGMFMLGGSGDMVGTVASVTNDTQLELEKNSLQGAGAGATYVLVSVRRAAVSNHSKGLITTATNSPVVNGVDTKFKELSNSYSLFRASDYTFIGAVDAVQTNTTLSLTANAGVAMSDEPFIAVPHTGVDFRVSAAENRKVGLLHAFFANRACWANYPGSDAPASDEFDSGIFFADPLDMEAVDTSIDGDFTTIPNRANAPGPIVNITATPTALLVLKTNVAYTITGSSPLDFIVRHLLDDGCLDGRAVQVYEDAVIWPGRNGLYVFDGLTVQNVLQDSWGVYWTDTVKSFQTGTDYMCAAVHRDHYILHIENATPPRGVTKNGVETIPNRITLVLNLRTGAITRWTNVDIRGAKNTPPPFTPRTVALVWSADGEIVPVDMDALFAMSSDDNDLIVCQGNSAGPDFFWESKLWDFGIPETLKYVKWLKSHYRATGDGLRVEIIEDIGHKGTRLPDTLPPHEDYDSKYIDIFADQVPFLGVRIYRKSALTKNIGIARLTAYVKEHRGAR